MYMKNSVEHGIMLPVPFVIIFYLVYTYYITPVQSNWTWKNDADDINQTSFKFFDELDCRPEYVRWEYAAPPGCFTQGESSKKVVEWIWSLYSRPA